MSNGRSDLDSAAFALSSSAALLLLFWCLRLFEKAAPDSNQREQLKGAVWCLAAFLTAMFSYKVAVVVPQAFAAVVWAMAVATTWGGFYALFVYRRHAGAEVKVDN